MANCNNCGYENPEGNKFCGECGAKLFDEIQKEDDQIDGKNIDTDSTMENTSREEDGHFAKDEKIVEADNDLKNNEAQESTINENIFSMYKSKNKPMIRNPRFIYIACALVVVFVLVGIIGYNQYERYKENQFNLNVSEAEKYFNMEEYDKAKEYYQMALKYDSTDVALEGKIQQCNKFLASLNAFNSGTDLFSKNDYLGAYNTFKKVIPEDEERFISAKDKISESRKLYINEQLQDAKDLASKSDYGLALDRIDNILSLDSKNETAIALKTQYTNSRTKILEAERAKAEAARAKAEAEAKALAKTQGVRIGMTKQEVLDSSWGRPKDINKTITQYGTHEQWVYNGYNYLYFEDGILTSIQN